MTVRTPLRSGGIAEIIRRADKGLTGKVLLVSLAVLSSLWLNSWTSGAQSTCPVSAQWDNVCYQPSKVGQAERLLPERPLDPSKVVARVMGLPLTLVVAGKRLLPTPSKGVVDLVFAYGDVPFDQVDAPQPPVPKWMAVTEALGHVKQLQGMRLWRDEVGGKKGTWHLWANLPLKKLNVLIVTNQDRTVVRAVGTTLIRAAKKLGRD